MVAYVIIDMQDSWLTLRTPQCFLTRVLLIGFLSIITPKKIPLFLGVFLFAYLRLFILRLGELKHHSELWEGDTRTDIFGVDHTTGELITVVWVDY